MTDTSDADDAHTGPDELAMMAMGEPGIAAPDERHVQQCPECRDELISLRRVAALARSGAPIEDPLDTPAPAVWDSISRALGLAPDVVPVPFALAMAESRKNHFPPPDTETLDPTLASRFSAPGHRVSRRRRRLVGPLVAGVLAVAAATGAIFVAATALAPKTTVPTQTILAEARLKALPNWSGSSGEAILEKTGSERQVVVTVSEPRKAPGYREVWLMSSDLTKLISVGVLDGEKGRFTIPTDIDLADYPIVDVSSEQPDGNPAHSGDSIVRGTL